MAAKDLKCTNGWDHAETDGGESFLEQWRGFLRRGKRVVSNRAQLCGHILDGGAQKDCPRSR